jgi:hypothetical protein
MSSTSDVNSDKAKIARLESEIRQLTKDVADNFVILKSKVGKHALTDSVHNVESAWSFRNIKVPAAFDRTYYEQVVFIDEDYTLDSVDYSSEFWIDDLDHDAGSYGKIVDITTIKARVVYFNKTTSAGTSVFPRYYNTSAALTTDTVILPGVYMYQRSATVDVSSVDYPSFIPISPFLD